MRAYYGAKDAVVPPDRGEMIRKAIDQAGGKQAEVIILQDKGHNAASVPYSQPEFSAGSIAIGNSRKRCYIGQSRSMRSVSSACPLSSRTMSSS